MTITNSPDNSSSQVHNIINKIENKLLLQRDDQQIRQQFIHNRLKTLTEPYILQTDKRYFSHTKENRNIDVNNFNKNQLNMNHFNPFADENDSGVHFQLSKSIVGNAQVVNNLQRNRFFGNDRTNIINNTSNTNNNENNLIKPKYQTHTTNTSNLNFFHNKFDDNARNAAFTDSLMRNVANSSNNISSNTIMNSGGTLNAQNNTNSYFMKQSSMKNMNAVEVNNEIMFKNYDLNDEYWLNFDQ